ncbi:MAG: hypothetical protein ABI036_16140 [Fibrobacteria bacterium]
MNIAKPLTSLSLAIAMVGALVMIAPSSADAAGKVIKKTPRICLHGKSCGSNFKPVKPTSRCKKGNNCPL